MCNCTMTCLLRTLFALLTVLTALSGADRLRAHEGAHAPDMLAAVTSATRDGNTVVVDLVLTGLGGPLVLVAVSSEGARVQPMDPVYVDFAQDVAVRSVIVFDAPAPSVFTLTLDFGPLGRGAVTVTPARGLLPKLD